MIQTLKPNLSATGIVVLSLKSRSFEGASPQPCKLGVVRALNSVNLEG